MLAVQKMRDGCPTDAIELLKRAEVLAENNETGLAMTYNNLACYYRKSLQLRTALTFLEKALAIEQKQPMSASKADTHLNMCAVLSQLSRHDHAMAHAYQAIIIVQSTLLMNHLPNPAGLMKADKEKNAHKGSAANKDKGMEQLQNSMTSSKEFKDRIAVLTIAYHNLAVEQEFMHMYHEAVASYRQAKEFANKYLGTDDTISRNLT
mmetsp:Transcript_1237/g.1905  ORF Transcript_1237/g.1905 Transcript_1237/m.1905 type:complete len:207 (+) Transcript_1237:309-929(+)